MSGYFTVVLMENRQNVCIEHASELVSTKGYQFAKFLPIGWMSPELRTCNIS